MKSTLFIFLICYFLTPTFVSGQTTRPEQIQVIARVRAVGSKIEIIRSNEGDVIPSLLQNKKLENTFNQMKSGDEAIIRGYITYISSSETDGPISHKPVFMIESITPISLKILANTNLPIDIENYHSIRRPETFYRPITIPISTEVASAVTIATTALLFQNLSSTPNQPNGKENLDQGVLMYAGLFATSIFVYQQISTSLSRKK